MWSPGAGAGSDARSSSGWPARTMSVFRDAWLHETPAQEVIGLMPTRFELSVTCSLSALTAHAAELVDLCGLADVGGRSMPQRAGHDAGWQYLHALEEAFELPGVAQDVGRFC